uniref:Putative secreted protein n=1 Tax=Anopheles darlingi TaxID=43151 RepID=A0A2M4DEL5_ANODA
MMACWLIVVAAPSRVTLRLVDDRVDRPSAATVLRFRAESTDCDRRTRVNVATVESYGGEDATMLPPPTPPSCSS